MIKQLSVYVENRKGSMVTVTELLADAGINLRSLCVADTEKFGILRLIVDDHEKAYGVLKASGYAVNLRDVVAFAVPDAPGGIAGVLRLLSDNDINMEYLYVLVTKSEGSAYSVMRVSDNDNTERILTENGVEVLREKDIS